MKSTIEISKAQDELLITMAKQTICCHPILKEIYDDSFLKQLVENKRDKDNQLLFWLVTDNEFDLPIARKLFEEIEGILSLFYDISNSDVLRSKLRQWHSIPFESTITELEFVAEYFKRGYQIELEPLLPNNRKADFSAVKEDQKIFFEVKIAYKEKSAKNKAIIDELTERCNKIDQPFLILLNVEENFDRSQIIVASQHISKKLRELKATSCNLPFSFDYPECNNPIITVDVTHRFPDGEKGSVGGSTFGGGITSKWTDIRSKIEQGIRQLHPDFPGVVIIRRHGLDYTQYDIQNALFGDLSVNLQLNTKKVHEFRMGDRIFGKQKNTRLSAVIFYDKSLHKYGYIRKKIVYHNPFALGKLPKEVFEGENVTQFP